MKHEADRLIIEQLQKQILKLQGNRHVADEAALGIGLEFIETAFPEKVFPRGAVHELISTSSETATCTSGFISVIISKLLPQSGSCLWVSTVPRRSIYPPALKSFGIAPERISFVDARNTKETLWVLEESLKCEALTAVVGELSEISFNDSRRLQLAVERSRVTGFIHRYKQKTENVVACVSRWKITPLSSSFPDALPGVGYARWQVELCKVRNGLPASWQVQWVPEVGLLLDSPSAGSGRRARSDMAQSDNALIKQIG